jgi:hypothetical protein
MSTFETHYSIDDLAKLWGVDRKTVTRRLVPYLDRIPDFNPRCRYGPKKRAHRLLRIPESVARQIYQDFIARRARS